MTLDIERHFKQIKSLNQAGEQTLKASMELKRDDDSCNSDGFDEITMEK